MRPKSQLRDAQQRVATALYERNALQAIVPMGGGKTAAALTALRELIDDGEVRCGLCVAPKRVARRVWRAEIREWEHLQGTTIQVVDGNEAQRTKMLLDDRFDLYTICINHLPWLMKFVKKLPKDHRLLDLLIVDESSKLKNPTGTWSRDLLNKAYLFKNKWLLTGTPRPNGYMDQFRPIAILSHGKAWGTRVFGKWKRHHFEATDYGEYNWVIRPEHEARVLQTIRSYTLAIDPSDMPDVPELVIVPHWLEMPKDARAVYDKMQKEYLVRFDGNVVAAMNAAIAEGKLAQMANGFVYGEDREVFPIHDEKLEELKTLVNDLDGDPALLVYEFREDLAVMREEFPGMPYLGGGVSDKQADLYEDEWEKRALPLLGLHPASAGHGMNLQHGGNQLIVYGFPWSAELFNQTTERIHRPGQQERCFVHLLLMKGTVDEVKYNRVVEKMNDQIAFNSYMERFK